MAVAISDYKNGIAFSGAGPGDGPIRFTLLGGRYAASCAANFGGGTVDLQILAADGSTYIDVSAATKFAAAGFATVDLPAGSYQVAITTATGIAFALAPLPYRPAA